jgi:hypothetical protein
VLPCTGWTFLAAGAAGTCNLFSIWTSLAATPTAGLQVACNRSYIHIKSQ